ncbi:hypothetical protein ACJX0J_038142, partial [Zea mays]
MCVFLTNCEKEISKPIDCLLNAQIEEVCITIVKTNSIIEEYLIECFLAIILFMLM